MNNKKRPYDLFNGYCLRTPLFPISYFHDLTKEKVISNEKIKEILNNTTFLEALYITSPELYNQIIKWSDGKIVNESKENKIKLTILKYATRISSRCTPFGLYAACGFGEFSTDTNINIKSFNRKTRFDNKFLSSLLTKIFQNDDLKNQVKFYPNSSLYKIGHQFRYIAYEFNDDLRNYYLDGFNTSEYLEILIDYVKGGKTIPKLIELLIGEGINIDEATSFILNLINEQILVSELELSVTGEDYLTNLTIRLRKTSIDKGVVKMLNAAQLNLKSLDTNETSNIYIYKKVSELIQPIFEQNDIKNTFQVDSFLNFENNTLQFGIKKKIIKTLGLFNKITRPNTESRIDHFKTTFKMRYEQAEIPLAIALDSESGIAYGDNMSSNNSLIDKLPTNTSKKKYKDIVWSEFDKIIQTKFYNALKNNDYSISINDSDVDNLVETWDDLPDTFSTAIELYGDKLIYMNGAGGSTALNLFSRFCYGTSELINLGEHITKIENELNKGKIIAEIVHVPQLRTVNILHRPILREYEIPYLANSSVAKKNQISINDILISIRNDRIVLRSKKLNKEIIPKLSNAHNFTYDSLPIYQFLCELQTQNKRNSIGFSWNYIFLNNNFLPRVEYGGVIISKAKWNINTLDIKKILKSPIRINNIREYRKNLKIPRLAQLVDGDNKLLINFENITSVLMLYDCIKGIEKFELEEFIFDEKCIVKKEGKPYCNQFIVPIFKNIN